MNNVVLTIHLLLALGLILVVLLQRSEGGGLGMGGGGGGGGVMSGRAAATALSKLTWALGIGFVITSLTLTIISARDTATDSVIDGIGDSVPAGVDPAQPPDLGGDLLPVIPSDAPATPPPVE